MRNDYPVGCRVGSLASAPTRTDNYFIFPPVGNLRYPVMS